MTRSPWSPLGVALLVACADPPPPPLASPPDPDNPSHRELAALLDGADTAFEGVVVDLQTVMSAPTGAAGPLPHTIVTYEVLTPIASARAGERLRLRFLGGRFPDGRQLIGSEQPRFTQGDHDVVFVADNGRTDCPLVRCAGGRLRIGADGRLAGEDGAPWALDPAPTAAPSGSGALVVDDAPLPAAVGAELEHVLAVLDAVGAPGGSLAAFDLDPSVPFSLPGGQP